MRISCTCRRTACTLPSCRHLFALHCACLAHVCAHVAHLLCVLASPAHHHGCHPAHVGAVPAHHHAPSHHSRHLGVRRCHARGSRPHRPSCIRCSFRCSHRYCWFFNMEIVVLFISLVCPGCYLNLSKKYEKNVKYMRNLHIFPLYSIFFI